MTRSILAVFFIVAASAVCHAQQELVPSEKPDSRTCSGTLVESDVYETSRVSGLVVDTGDQFVPDVMLELSTVDGKETIKIENDAKGKFRFPVVPAGDYFLKARWKKKGFDCVKLRVTIKGSSENAKVIVLKPSPIVVDCNLES